jgi:chitodextrinase
VKAVDAAGNLSAASNTATATTPAGADTQAPSTPAALSATAASSSQINLSWTASTDNVGVTGYRVYRAGVQVGTPTATSFSDTGLTASTAYSYTVKAVDAAGNLSAASNTATATTLAGGGGTVVLAPTDDAYTRDGSNAANNYGSDTLLIVKTDTAGSIRYSYLKFDLATVGTVTSAKLRVYGSASASTTLTAYQAADSWTNSGLTWNNAPAAGAAAGSVALTATVQYYEIDVTAYVNAQLAGDKVVSFVLKESAGKYTTFNSNNNSSNKPQLKIN